MTIIKQQIRTLAILLFLSYHVFAHIEMSYPFPINSALDPATPEAQKDYNYKSPLDPSGSNYPCKGYLSVKTPSKATWQAGGTYNLTLQGTADHDGGSCQLSLSLDLGKTFKVIQSMIGGCPLPRAYNFTIPSFIPSSSEALFSWSWFNVVGNREMYQNCAWVTIEGAAPGRHRRAQYERQESVSSLPDMFTCNIGDGCTSIEQQDVDFPHAGSTVLKGTDKIAVSPGKGFVVSGAADSLTVTSTAAASDAGEIATVPTPSTASISTQSSTFSFGFASFTDSASSLQGPMSPSPSFPNATATSKSLGIYLNPTTSQSPTSPLPTSSVSLMSTTAVATGPGNSASLITSSSSSSAATTSYSPLAGPCTVGSFACNSPSTFSECVPEADGSTSYTFMGSVAAGMQCVDGKIIRQNAGSCSPDGALQCDVSGNSFYLCDNGGLVAMGPVAPGTQCVNGQIVYVPGQVS